MLSDANFLPYGKSMVEPARKNWKQLTLMEDAMMIHRIMRAPEKRIFKVDIGNIPPNEVDNYMQRINTGGSIVLDLSVGDTLKIYALLDTNDSSTSATVGSSSESKTYFGGYKLIE